MIFTIGRWDIEHEPDITRQCYSAKPEGMDCHCTDCQEFTAVIDKAFPQEFVSIANSLGFDIRKPAELCHYGREGSGLRITGGWFHVVGKLLSGRDAMRQVSENDGIYELEKLTDNFEFGVTNNLALVPASFVGKPLVQLEFVVRFP
jgi:hypothetical protein